MSTIDPTAVKAGDTVTLRSPASMNRGTVDVSATIIGVVQEVVMDGASVRLHGVSSVYPLKHLTDHQPAPEPEWLCEFKGEAGPEGDEHWAKRFSAREDAVRSLRSSVQSYELDDFQGPVSFSLYSDATGPDFVPDDSRPLPTREQVEDLLARYGMGYSVTFMDDLFALFRGEPR